MRKPRTEFIRGTLVRYLGPTSRPAGTDRIRSGAIYTVAHATAEWLSLQELPGQQHAARDFVRDHHLAEDHWVGAHA